VRSTPAQRLCALGASVLVGLVVGVAPAAAAAPAPAATGGSASLAEQVDQLNARIERVGDELARGAIEYEAAAGELDRLVQLQFASDADHDALEDATTDSRDLLAGLARSAYKGTMSPGVTALMSGDPRALSDLAYVRKSVGHLGVTREQVVRDLSAKTADAVRASQQTAELRAQALGKRQALDAQLVQLTEKTDLLSAELTAAAQRLAQARAADAARALAAAQAKAARDARDAEARRALAAATAAAAAAGVGLQGTRTGSGASTGTGGCLPASTHGEANGFLSPASLCSLELGGGHRLRTDAAGAMNALNRAKLAATGTPLCLTDSYRSYPEQVDIFRRKPGLAATPGRSQHGWGMAVDLCGGVQDFSSEAHRWMQVNAPQFGWNHPDWARAGGSRPEAWHWEYTG
jgi:D-alanyl-D-alanine carboxypeptidase